MHHAWVALAVCAGAQSWTRHSKSGLTCYAEGAWLSWDPQTISFFRIGQLKRVFTTSVRKQKSSCSSAVRFLYYLTDFKPVAPCVAVSRSFFCLQPSFFMNLQTVFFPRTGPFLANCFESCHVKFPFVSFLQNYFRCLIYDFLSSRSFLVFKTFISWRPFYYPTFKDLSDFFSNFLNFWASRSKAVKQSSFLALIGFIFHDKSQKWGRLQAKKN